MALRKVQLWGFNPLQNGQIHGESYSLSYDDSGEFKHKKLIVLDQTLYNVIETDYTNYAIVYECTRNFPFILNYTEDNIHIFTRSETVTADDLTTYKNAAVALITSKSTGDFEDLTSGRCTPADYTAKLNELFTDPDNFFRKW